MRWRMHEAAYPRALRFFFVSPSPSVAIFIALFLSVAILRNRARWKSFYPD
jgi:hypothetical protein